MSERECLSASEPAVVVSDFLSSAVRIGNALLRRAGPLVVWAIATAFAGTGIVVGVIASQRVERDALGETERRVVQFISGVETALNRTLIGADVLLSGFEAPLRGRAK